MYENAFIYNVSDTERPVRFGFLPEEREWLKQERSIEEIMKFIDENALEFAVLLAQHNNDIGFTSMPAVGEYVKDGDTYIFRMDTSTDGKPSHQDFPCQEMTEQDYRNYRKYRKHMHYSLIFLTEKNELSLVSVCDTDDDGNGADLLEREVTIRFLKAAGVNSYHKLGKLINKGQDIYNRWVEENREFPGAYGNMPE